MNKEFIELFESFENDMCNQIVNTYVNDQNLSKSDNVNITSLIKENNNMQQYMQLRFNITEMYKFDPQCIMIQINDYQ